ncbi:DegT/DnrJ/EryC1/StrS family aminotransferase [Streptomyces sp. NBC_01275]|uniref:DegT/DnrJ/EryC1/StrS family aminotransferase n=1 Tax=Streptomyces sp. NBC_01275 TaxID=2903807 RepID=UPI002255F4BC|nr:DegT/DnrJ/EryC1/StrS family aminotransferase [Streptomyces sp. NBC_01275]MCX4763825.1 DegT/DnrJ/EryC1/StrS family aminotransferase [Streptomyces sp. NBC_01275]
MPDIRIPSFSYSFTESDVAFITDEVGRLFREGRHLTMGAHGEALEEEFVRYTGVRHAVSVASGTAALEIALRSLDVAGGEVVVPTNTFGATVVSVLRAGAVPVFADTGDDMSVSVADVAAKLGPRVRAVVTVHIGGLISPHTLELARLCEERGIPLVEDAAHAAGASLQGRHAGSFGVAAAFSLFSTKVMTSGEGGLLVTDDERIRDRARLLRDHAKNPDGTMSTTGYNWRLTEMQAIVSRTQLRRLDEMVRGRNAVAALYDERLAEVEGIRLLTPPTEAVHNRYKYIVELERHRPRDVQKILRDRYGIALGGYVYDVPCHLQEAFRSYATGPFPGADRMCPAHICPPVYPDMPLSDAAHVADALSEVLRG